MLKYNVFVMWRVLNELNCKKVLQLLDTHNMTKRLHRPYALEKQANLPDLTKNIHMIHQHHYISLGQQFHQL